MGPVIGSRASALLSVVSCAPLPYLSVLLASPPDSERVPKLDRGTRESAGRSGRRAMPQHARRRPKSAPSPDGCRNSLGVGRVARRARPVIKPYSRPLPRLILKAGHKEGLPTTPIAACGAICPSIRADPFFIGKHTGVLLCIDI